MKIDAINHSISQVGKATQGTQKSFSGSPEDDGFLKMLGRSIDSVNALQNEASMASEAVVTGKAENLHQTMIALEKAETSLKLLVQVRNKALEAYNEIMRMQV